MYRLNTMPLLRRTMKQKRKPNPVVLKKLAIALAITLIAAFCYIKAQPHTFEAHQQNQLEHKSQQLKSTLNQLEQQKVQDSATQKKLDETNKQLQDTQKQLEAKRNTATAYAAELPYAGALASSYSGSGDQWLDYIISRESGGCATKWQGQTSCPAGFAHIYDGDINDTFRGYGLCQSTPAIKMASAGADWATNPATQIAWCKQYAIARYGSTYNAYQHWLANRNW